jgi:phage baseplate assembly protein W
LVNLILTKKGEREMQPDFGCDIHNLIFEQIVEESIATDIENSILDAVNIWLPYINVDNIIFDYDENDIDANRITLEVQFSLKSNPSLTETLNVSINN